MRKILLSIASLLIFAGSINATNIGYSKDDINRLNTFRLGSSHKQGQAIRFSHAKLQALKGKTIDFAEFVVGSKNTTDNNINVFLATTLTGTPIAEGTLEVKRGLTKIKWTLDKPYTITGEEECLYIGYTAEIGTTYNLLISDKSYDIEGCNFAYKDDAWVDTYGMDRGSALIFVNVEDADNLTDAIIGKSNFDGYYKAGDKCKFTAQFINAGTTNINSFDAVVEIGGSKTTQHFADLNIEPKEAYSFPISDIDTSTEGAQNISITIANVNGADKEADTSDNSVSSELFFYPKNMERSLLLESFTGQGCQNCPGGHLNIEAAIKKTGKDIVEVAHHVGYKADLFTMSEDPTYVFFYPNISSTFAPAAMVNRNTYANVSTSPIVEATSIEKLLSTIYYADTKEPYVSLYLKTTLDESTRELNVKLYVLPHKTVPHNNSVFNVFLVQDGIEAYQEKGGDNYTHNRVFRGTVTGNAWGYSVKDITAGKLLSWEKTITIPDSIHSSYYADETKNNVEAVLKNMSVVAYIGEFDQNDNTKHTIYNCCEARLGESHKQTGFAKPTDVNSAEAEQTLNIFVNNGKVCVEGDYSRLSVYNLAGAQVENAALAKGVYIVKVVAGGKQTTKKILVR